MNGPGLQRLRVEQLGCTSQQELADRLLTLEGGRLPRTQQALSRLERQSQPFGSQQARKLQEALLRLFPEQGQAIRAAFDEDATLDREKVFDAAHTEPPVTPLSPRTEQAALPWAVTFRTECLLEELTCHAEASGLAATRLAYPAYGLVLNHGTTALRQHRELLFPTVSFDLKAETILLVGSSFRHPAVATVLAAIRQKHPRLAVRFVPETPPEQRPHFFFGYPTRFNDLLLNATQHRSLRTVDELGRLRFEDYGVIIHCPLAGLVRGRGAPFGQPTAHARRLIVVAGAHRLGTGIGVRLLEQRALRTEIFGPVGTLEGTGMLAFQVVLQDGPAPRMEVKRLLTSDGQAGEDQGSTSQIT